MDRPGGDVSNDASGRRSVGTRGANIRANTGAGTEVGDSSQEARSSTLTVGAEKSGGDPDLANENENSVWRDSDLSITSGATDSEMRSESPLTKEELLEREKEQNELTNSYNERADEASGLKKLNLEAAASSSQISVEQYKRAIKYIKQSSELSVLGNFKNAELLSKASEQAQTAATHYAAAAEAHLSQQFGELFRFESAASNSKASAEQYASAVEYLKQASELNTTESSHIAEFLRRASIQAQFAAERYAEVAAGCLSHGWSEQTNPYPAALNSQASAEQYAKIAEYLKQASETSNLGNSNDADFLNKASEQAQAAATDYAAAAEAHLSQQWGERARLETAAFKSRSSAEKYASRVEYSKQAAEASSAGASAAAVLFGKASKVALTNLDQARKHAREAKKLQTSELSILANEKKEISTAAAEQVNKVRFLDENSSGLRGDASMQERASEDTLARHQQEAIEASITAEAAQRGVVKLIEPSNPENHQAELSLWDEVIEEAITAKDAWARMAAVCQEKVALTSLTASSQQQEEWNAHLQDANEMVRTWHAKTVSREANKAARIACQAQQKAESVTHINDKIFFGDRAVERACEAKKAYRKAVEAFQQGSDAAPEGQKEWWIKNLVTAEDNKATWIVNELWYHAHTRTCNAGHTKKKALAVLQQGSVHAASFKKMAIEKTIEAEQAWEKTVQALDDALQAAPEHLKGDWIGLLKTAEHNHETWKVMAAKDRNSLTAIIQRSYNSIQSMISTVFCRRRENAILDKDKMLKVAQNINRPSLGNELSNKEKRQFPTACFISSETMALENGRQCQIRILEVPAQLPVEDLSQSSFVLIEELIDTASDTVIDTATMIADHLLVILKEGANPEEVFGRLNPKPTSFKKIRLSEPFYFVQLERSSPHDLATLFSTTLKQLNALRQVVSCQPDFLYEASSDNAEENDDNSMPSLLERQKTKAHSIQVEEQKSDLVCNPIIGLIDRGVDTERLSPYQWINPSPSPTIGDTHGIHFFQRGNEIVSDNDIIDTEGHGIACREVINKMLFQYHPYSDIVKVMTCRTDRIGKKALSTASIELCIRYACEKGAKVLNCSIDGMPVLARIAKKNLSQLSSADHCLKDAFLFAKQHDAIVVLAAGNKGQNLDQILKSSFIVARDLGKSEKDVDVRMPNLLIVGANDRNGKLLRCSNYQAGTEDLKLSSDSNYGHLLVDLTALANAPENLILEQRFKHGTSMSSARASTSLAVIVRHSPEIFIEEGKMMYEDLIKHLHNNIIPRESLRETTRSGGELNLERALGIETQPDLISSILRFLGWIA